MDENIIDKIKRFILSAKEEAKQGPASEEPLLSTQPPEEIDQIKSMLSISKELDIPPINLDKYTIDTALLEIIPEDIARDYSMIPLARMAHELTVAIADPFNITAIDMLKSLIKIDIYLVIATPSDITKAIDKYYAASSLEKRAISSSVKLPDGIINEEDEEKGIVKIKRVGGQEAEENISEITKRMQEAPIIEMVNNIMVDAMKCRASDIHLEPFPEQTRLRYRIDGILHEIKFIPKEIERAVVARIKIMSNLDITQKRLPQDGRFSFRAEGRELDCRISILPIHSGEKVVLRLLEKGSLHVDLEKLGFSADVFEAFKQSVAKPHGMILLTGPTGSGKSTTLYAMLNTLDRIEKNIITIEDPVEYQMHGITQIQVKPEISLTFANTLRSVLRQNPNIIMIGEIRDFETVDIAMKSALTGHLILSTLHTNDAPSAIVRLMNMEVEPFLIASTLLLIAAQRLCRRICENCKEPYEIKSELVKGLPSGYNKDKVTLYRGKGCSRCNKTGYFGRIPVVQALLIDEAIKEMILKKAALVQIREYAQSKGMKTLRQDAIEKAMKGDISLEEALRITPEG